MRTLYKFQFDCWYGHLYGLFVEDSAKVNKLIKSKKEIYFGEVCGKHSEVYGPINDKECVAVTQDQKFIDQVIKQGLVFGYNPFDYETLEERNET